MNKLTYIFISLSLIVLSFSACKKIETPISGYESDPIYRVSGLVDEYEVDMIVDEMSCHLYSDTSTINGVKTYQVNVADDSLGIDVRIIVYRPERFIVENGNNLLPTGELKFLVNQSVCMELNGVGDQGILMDDLSLEVNGNAFGTNQFSVDEYGVYKSQVHFSNFNTSKVIDINVGFENQEILPGFDLEYGDSLIAEAVVTDYKHQWFLDSSLVSYQSVYTSSISYGFHSIKHLVTDNYGNEAEESRLFYYGQSGLFWVLEPSFCNTNFIPSNYSSLVVEVEKDGETFTSSTVSSNLNQEIEVISVNYVSDYYSGGLKMLIFNIKFNAILESENGNLMEMNEIEGTLYFNMF